MGLSSERLVGLMLSVATFLALLTAYLFPFHLLPWPTFYNEWLFAAFVVTGITAVIWYQGEWTIAIPSLLVFWIIVAVITSVGFHASDATSVGGMAMFLVYGLLAAMAHQLGANLQRTDLVKGLLGFVGLAALLSATVALLQWSGLVANQGWDPAFILYSEGGGRVSSNIGQANNLGTLLVMGMGAIGYAWYAFPQARRFWKALALLGSLLLVLGVYVSGSRTAVLNLLTWPVLLGIWAVWRRRVFPWLALFPIGGWLLLQWVMPPLIEWWGLFPAQEARSLVQDSSRLRLWAMVLTAIGESPWWGHGFGGVANAHLRLSPEFGAFDYSIAQHAHNTVLDMWAIFGLPLGTVIVAGVLWLAAKAWWRSTEAPQQFMWLMCSAMLVHALLEYPLHYGFFLWLLFMLLGSLGGQPNRTITFKRPALVSMVWLAVFGAVTISVWQGYVQLESIYTQYRQRGGEAVQQALRQRQEKWTDTLFAEPYERIYWLSKPVDEVVTLPAAELQRLERQASIYPLPGLGWRVAMAHTAQGRPEQAEWWAERMCAMFAKPVCDSGRQELEKLGLKPN